MGVLGNSKEQRTQLFFRDDGKFTFRKLEVEDTFLVEKTDNAIVRGWKHYYSLQFPFTGYGKIPADMVTLGYSRDIILDPFGLVSDIEKPEAGGVSKLDKRGISDVAETQRYKVQNKPTGMYLVDKVTLILGAGFLLQLIFAGIRGIWLK